MGSTRLPGKVLEDLAGQPMLARVVSRTRQAKTLDSVTIATTTLPADDAIVKLCKKMGWPCFRGSQDDVLDRYYRAALAFKADTVIRITSDCPLTDPGVIDLTVNAFLGQYPAVDYVSNSQTRTFPRGLDVEVFSFSALEKAWREDYNPAWREHVTIYLYRHPEKFKLLNVANDIDYSAMRWTVDTPEDLALVRQIYNHFQNNSFTWIDVLKLLKAHPEWTEINRFVQQKNTL